MPNASGERFCLSRIEEQTIFEKFSHKPDPKIGRGTLFSSLEI